MKTLTPILLLMMTFCLTSCGVSLGPQTKTEWIIANPGQPGKVMKNRKVTVLPEGASQPVEQDVGGWQVMPSEHFKALMRAVDGKKKQAPPPPMLPNKEETECDSECPPSVSSRDSTGTSEKDPPVSKRDAPVISPNEPVLRDGEEIIWPPQLRKK